MSTTTKLTDQAAESQHGGTGGGGEGADACGGLVRGG